MEALLALVRAARCCPVFRTSTASVKIAALGRQPQDACIGPSLFCPVELLLGANPEKQRLIIFELTQEPSEKEGQMKENPLGQRLRGAFAGAGGRHSGAGSTLPLVMRVSEGETIRLRVKFEPQEEETLTSLRTVTALAWLQPASDRRRSTPFRPILYTRLKSQTRVSLSLVATCAMISSWAPFAK